MLLRQFSNRHIACIKCNRDVRSAMPLITCVPLIILSSVVGGIQTFCNLTSHKLQQKLSHFASHTWLIPPWHPKSPDTISGGNVQKLVNRAAPLAMWGSVRVYRGIQSAGPLKRSSLHPWQTRSFRHGTRLVWGAFRHASITAQRLSTRIFQPLSIAIDSLRHHGSCCSYQEVEPTPDWIKCCPDTRSRHH